MEATIKDLSEETLDPMTESIVKTRYLKKIIQHSLIPLDPTDGDVLSVLVQILTDLLSTVEDEENAVEKVIQAIRDVTKLKLECRKEEKKD